MNIAFIKKRCRCLIVIFLAAFPVLWFFFGYRGVVRQYSLKDEQEDYIRRIANLKYQNMVFKNEIHRLTKNMEYLKQVINAELGYVEEKDIPAKKRNIYNCKIYFAYDEIRSPENL
jgi:cell division protein FtsB